MQLSQKEKTLKKLPIGLQGISLVDRNPSCNRKTDQNNSQKNWFFISI